MRLVAIYGLVLFYRQLLCAAVVLDEETVTKQLTKDLAEKLGVSIDYIESRARRKRSVASRAATMDILKTLGLDADAAEETFTLTGDHDMKENRLIKFSLPKDLSSLAISKTKLYINISPANIDKANRRKRKIIINIQLLDTMNNRNITVTKRIPKTRSIDGWYSVKGVVGPLTSIIKQYKHSQHSINMLVTCDACDQSPLDVSNAPIIVIQGSKPVTYSDSRSSKCQGRCCVRPLEIDFDKLGYDWILYPRRYTANYCEGSCNRNAMVPYDVAQLSTNTRVVQAMLQKLRMPAAGACCMPRNSSPVRIVYRDTMGIIRSDVSTLKAVNTCHCS